MRWKMLRHSVHGLFGLQSNKIKAKQFLCLNNLNDAMWLMAVRLSFFFVLVIRFNEMAFYDSTSIPDYESDMHLFWYLPTNKWHSRNHRMKSEYIKINVYIQIYDTQMLPILTNHPWPIHMLRLKIDINTNFRMSSGRDVTAHFRQMRLKSIKKILAT